MVNFRVVTRASSMHIYIEHCVQGILLGAVVNVIMNKAGLSRREFIISIYQHVPSEERKVYKKGSQTFWSWDLFICLKTIKDS